MSSYYVGLAISVLSLGISVAARDALILTVNGSSPAWRQTHSSVSAFQLIAPVQPWLLIWIQWTGILPWTGILWTWFCCSCLGDTKWVDFTAPPTFFLAVFFCQPCWNCPFPWITFRCVSPYRLYYSSRVQALTMWLPASSDVHGWVLLSHTTRYKHDSVTAALWALEFPSQSDCQRCSCTVSSTG